MTKIEQQIEGLAAAVAKGFDGMQGEFEGIRGQIRNLESDMKTGFRDVRADLRELREISISGSRPRSASSGPGERVRAAA